MNKLAKATNSFLHMQMHLDGGGTLGLKVPTFWDDTEKQWIAAIKTPKTRTLLTSSAKESFELQNSFNRVLQQAFTSPLADEVFSMFEKED